MWFKIWFFGVMIALLIAMVVCGVLDILSATGKFP